MTIFPKKAWTVLVYIAGDNNLDPYARKGFSKMRWLPSDEHLHIVAQFDGRGDHTYRYRFARLKQEQIGPPLDDINTGDPKELTRFINWGQTHFPAEKTALIIWNHGTGIKNLPANFDYASIRSRETEQSKIELQRTLFDATLHKLSQRQPRLRGIAIDATARDYLDTQELASALAAAQQDNRKLDLIGFDACLMNILEIAYEIHDYAHFMVGSQETASGSGWPYDKIFTALAAAPEMTAKQLGETVVHEYSRATGKEMRGRASPYTQAVLDLGQTSQTYTLIETLSNALLVPEISSHGVFEYALRQMANEVKRFQDRDLADLGHWCELLHSKTNGPMNKTFREPLNALISHLEPGAGVVVVADAHGGNDMDTINGLSIYWPNQTIIDIYDDLRFAQSRWGELAKRNIELQERS